MKLKKSPCLKKTHALLLLLAISLMLLSFNALAVTFSFCKKLDKSGYCHIDASLKKKEPYTHLVHCGQHFLTISAANRDTLNAYLRNNKNMIVKYERDKLFIDGRCF